MKYIICNKDRTIFMRAWAAIIYTVDKTKKMEEAMLWTDEKQAQRLLDDCKGKGSKHLGESWIVYKPTRHELLSIEKHQRDTSMEYVLCVTQDGIRRHRWIKDVIKGAPDVGDRFEITVKRELAKRFERETQPLIWYNKASKTMPLFERVKYKVEAVPRLVKTKEESKTLYGADVSECVQKMKNGLIIIADADENDNHKSYQVATVSKGMTHIGYIDSRMFAKLSSREDTRIAQLAIPEEPLARYLLMIANENALRDEVEVKFVNQTLFSEYENDFVTNALNEFNKSGEVYIAEFDTEMTDFNTLARKFALQSRDIAISEDKVIMLSEGKLALFTEVNYRLLTTHFSPKG